MLLCMVQHMETITIEDLGVLCRIGVPDEERAKPQRLLICIEMKGDFASACRSDDLTQTVNYWDVAERVRGICQKTSFRLIERLAHEIAAAILKEFAVAAVSVEVKKFILTDARYVSFRLTEQR